MTQVRNRRVLRLSEKEANALQVVLHAQIDETRHFAKVYKANVSAARLLRQWADMMSEITQRLAEAGQRDKVA